MALQERRAENERWFQIVSGPQRRSALRAQIADTLTRHHCATALQLLMLEQELQKAYQDIGELNGYVAQQEAHLSERAALIKRLANRVDEKDAALARHAFEAGRQLRSCNEVIETLLQRIAQLQARLGAAPIDAGGGKDKPVPGPDEVARKSKP